MNWLLLKEFWDFGRTYEIRIYEPLVRIRSWRNRNRHFASAVDRMIPFVMNCFNNGLSWIEAGVEFEKVQKMLRPRIELASEDMLDTFDVLIRKAFDEGKLL